MNNKNNKFLLGGAICAAQAEGNFDIDGKTLTVADLRFFDKNNKPKDITAKDRRMTTEKLKFAIEHEKELYFPKREGIDFYNTYKEDIKFFKEANMNCFRFSIAWSRIMPNCDGVINQKAVEYYENIFKTLKENNITPIVTIIHNDIPYVMIEKYGGWHNKQFIDGYLQYAKFVVERFKKYVKYWIPFNEINATLFTSWHGAGIVDDAFENLESVCYNALHNQFVALAKLIEFGKTIANDFQFLGMTASFLTYPIDCNPKNVLFNQQQMQIKNYFYYEVMAKGKYPTYIKNYFKAKKITLNILDGELELIKNNPIDGIALSYYSSGTTSTENIKELDSNLITTGANPFLQASEWGWQIDPIGLKILVHEMHERFNLPIMIAENGLGSDDFLTKDNQIHDDYRISYIKQHLDLLKESIAEGVNIFSYTLWTPIDVISSGTNEMTKRYGLIYVDLDNEGNGSKKRIFKDSYFWFKEYAQSFLNEVN
ncbi:glycoside hydrolase family 1 protein [Spiroplasma culicicola]|uniref:6-phospho-beta-glucosidase n=1 Tax=Spiroplasma culicicola AES-1 TaxID=1276246 RepID=W6A857_9MOLU|nr:glycoside hydrolase family 1 protein [Spiroplasma culicicola]AHI53172.1 6-phospho-beta-glucosidase [Spiroplasma culicicola AES-1]